MSSFDKTAGKNLDEILASIRKTLADESTPADAAQALVQANSSASPSGNGSPVASVKIDDDFADLLAGGLGTAPVPSAGTEAADGTDQKDPLWFLRPSGGRQSQAVPLPPERSLPSLDGLVDSLSPQRSSLAPQFISDSHGEGIQPAGTDLSSSASPGEVATSPVPAAEPRTDFEAKPANGLSPEAMGPGVNGSDPTAGVAPPAAATSDPAVAAKAPAVSPASTEAEPKSKSPASAGKADAASPVVKPEAAPVKPDSGQQQAAAKGIPGPPADAGKPAAAPATATPSRFGGGPV